MSSIDKYVESEARQYNPRVQVTNSMGRIVGRVNGRVVFSIPDRYGYLSEDERTIIRDSMNQFEEEEREMRRREQERIEAERQAAKRRLENAVTSAFSRLESSHIAAMEAFQASGDLSDLKKHLSRIKGYKLVGFDEKIAALESSFESSRREIEQEYARKSRELQQLRNNITPNASGEEYARLERQVATADVRLSPVQMPVGDVRSVENELNALDGALLELANLERKLKSIEADGMIADVVSAALRRIHGQSISGVEDANKIFESVMADLERIKELSARMETLKSFDLISRIEGMLSAITEFREHKMIDMIHAKSNRDEILQVAEQVLEAYKDLSIADYTTCEADRVEDIINYTQTVIMDGSSSYEALNRLQSLLREADSYMSHDGLIRSEYEEYLRNVDELISRGVDISGFERFDANNSEAQLDRLFEMLIDKDLEDAASCTTSSFVMACETMEEMGFQMLYYNLEDQFAHEAVYARPGCEGVVWQVITSGTCVRRRMLGINTQVDGREVQTSVEELKRMAEEFDRAGEPQAFLDLYADRGGGNWETLNYVEGENMTAEDVYENGYFQLDAEGLQKYNSIVAQGMTVEQRSEQVAHVLKPEIRVKKRSDEQRRNESAACEARVMAKRRR